MIFLDTSAIYALADTLDANHDRAVELFSRALTHEETLLVHNYILVESAALLQRRLGTTSAMQFMRDADTFQVHWIEADDHRRSIAIWHERKRRNLSLVDCMSFLVMRLYDVRQVLAFDSDFEREGFDGYVGVAL